jgi:glycosyltransferase involved in cell wall biosynthesis
MSIGQSPTVSAVIPTYNRVAFLCDAIDSILNQSHPVDEIVVIDDGSTDSTLATLKKYGTAIRCISQRNQGPSAARNHGMRVAKGDFVAFLDSDDIWVPKKLELQIAFVDKNPEIDFIFGKMVNFHEMTGAETPDIIDPEVYRYLVEHSANLERFFEMLISQNFVAPSSLMARRQSLVQLGFFDESRMIAEDLDYWLRSSVRCKWGFIDQTLVKRRRHSGNLIADWTKWNVAMIQVLDRTARALAPQRGAERLLTGRLRDLNYDVGSASFKQRKMNSAYRYLRDGRREGGDNLKWRIKLLAAAFLRHIPGCRQ